MTGSGYDQRSREAAESQVAGTECVSLEKLLGRLELGPFLRIAAAISDAVAALHASAVVHHDLTPSSISVDLQRECVCLSMPRPGSSLTDLRALRTGGATSNLAYLAPERTRRLASEVDSRADLYSLGVTLYQLATGKLPLAAGDPREWVHAHVAVRPAPIADGARIPAAVEGILLKLLEKDPDDRYQSASGLAYDIRDCQAQLTTSGHVLGFPLGRRDASGRLRKRVLLRGRQRELELLTAAVTRVQRTGAPELVLVSGYSGIGKSSLVGELLGQSTPRETLVASGKCENLESDAPYAALMQAFRQLCRWVLAKPGAELSDWRTALTAALGGNAGIVAELVPELTAILGSRPSPSWLPARETQSRVHASFRRFLGALAARQRPLVLFLDDLQWIDAASLGLLEHLLLDPELSNVLLIGAYRSESVPTGHPLETAIARLIERGRAVHTLALKALAPLDILQLVADLLQAPQESLAELALIVEKKTGGNPFFVRQFMTALVEERLLQFDQQCGVWRWDALRILAKASTDNLADLLLERLGRLPEQTRQTLESLAGLGVRSDLTLLAELAGVSVDEQKERLRVAVDAGVLVQAGDAFAFSHDRLLGAAYSRIPEAERPALHLRLGRVLRGHGSGVDGDGLFEIVRHMNRAVSLLDDPRERVELAELNLKFARRSRATAASRVVVAYLDKAIALLPVDHFRTLPGLSFELALSRAESKFLCGDHAEAEAILSDLAGRELDVEQLGAVVCVQLPLYSASNRFAEAIQTGLRYLRSAGVPWQGIGDDELRRQHLRLKQALGDRPVASLLDAPALRSPVVRTIMEVCACAHASAFHTDQRLLALLVMHMATLSIEHGNCDISVQAYGTLSIVLGPFFGEHELGLEFGKLGARLAERGENRFAARAWLLMGSIVAPRAIDAHAGRAWLIRGREAADQFGDIVSGIYNRSDLAVNLFAGGAPLDEAERCAELAIEFAASNRFTQIVNRVRILRSLIRGLREQGREPGSLSDELFDEAAFEQSLGSSVDRYYYWVRRLEARYFAGDLEGARASARRASALVQAARNFPLEIELWLFGALAEAACADPADAADALSHLEGHAAELRAWAQRCPATFANKSALVDAEAARLSDRHGEAEHFFERAAQLARQYQLPHEEALAHELTARFYQARGISTVARAKLSLARALYLQWGALVKVAELDAQLSSGDDLGVTPPLADSLEQLDVRMLVGALQAVSSSLELDKLVDALMKSALQHVAAERGLLVLSAAEPRVRARARCGNTTIEVVPDDSAASPELLPETVLRYVLRSGERVMTHDGVVPDTLRDDPYLSRQQVRSLLCVPIVVRAKVHGALYLENTLTKQAYGARDVALLELIASQAAVSLENAQLYAGLHLAQQRMVRAERVSRTGSFSFRPATREFELSEEIINIFQLEGEPTIPQFRGRVHPDDRGLFDAMITETTRYQGKPMEHRLLMPDGTLKYVVSIFSQQAPGEFVGTIRDVTEAKQNELTLARTQAALADLRRVASLGEMAAAIAHEVNQPLAGIALNTSTCLRCLEKDAPNLGLLRQATLRIQRDADRAGAVVHRLRALFGKSEAAKIFVDLNDAIREVVTLSRVRIREVGAKLALELRDDLPKVLGDRVQLQQVVMNLITNALDAMTDVEEHSRALLVRTLREDGNRVRCEVRDSGPGVSESDRAQIFKTFYTTKHEGMGVGLAISSNIVASHGGELSVLNNVDAPGSTFAFWLPAVEVSPSVSDGP